MSLSMYPYYSSAMAGAHDLEGSHYRRGREKQSLRFVMIIRLLHPHLDPLPSRERSRSAGGAAPRSPGQAMANVKIQMPNEAGGPMNGAGSGRVRHGVRAERGGSWSPHGSRSPVEVVKTFATAGGQCRWLSRHFFQEEIHSDRESVLPRASVTVSLIS